MTILSIFTFVSTISNFQYSTEEYLKISREIYEVVEESYFKKEILFNNNKLTLEQNKQKTSNTLSTFSYEETNFNNYVLGDNGKACSTMQLHIYGRFGLSCNELQSSRKLALATGLKFMVYLKKFCNNDLYKGFLAYASGKCEGNKTAIKIIDKRCRMIGGC